MTTKRVLKIAKQELWIRGLILTN